MIPSGLLIVGFGGHARSIADVALDLGIGELAFVDAGARTGEAFAGFPVRATMPDSLPAGWTAIPAAGDNAVRRRQIDAIGQRSFALEPLVSKRAYIGHGARLLAGAFIAHHGHVGPLASIGRGVIINTGAVVDHESVIGDFSHIAVNATVAGGCMIGRLVFIGAGATVIDHIRIGDGVIVGAGSTVIGDIAEPGTYVGCPARRVERG